MLESLATPFLVTFTIKLLEVYSTGVKAIGRITVPRKTMSPPPPRREDRFGTLSARFPSRYHHVARPSLRTMARNKERGNKGILARASALVSGTCETVRLEWTIRPDEWTLRGYVRSEAKRKKSFARSLSSPPFDGPPFSSASDTVPLPVLDVQGVEASWLGIDASSST